MKTHIDLDVWKFAIEFVTEIYKLTNHFPQSEIYGLSSQMRRSAVSIPSNIAEGAARNSKKEFSHFLSIALGSIAEIETQLIISNNLNYIDSVTLTETITKLSSIRKMTFGLKRSLFTP